MKYDIYEDRLTDEIKFEVLRIVDYKTYRNVNNPISKTSFF